MCFKKILSDARNVPSVLVDSKNYKNRLFGVFENKYLPSETRTRCLIFMRLLFSRGFAFCFIVTLDAFELNVSTRNRVPLTNRKPLRRHRHHHHHGQDVSGVFAGLPPNVLLHTLQSAPGQPRRTHIQGMFILTEYYINSSWPSTG